MQPLDGPTMYRTVLEERLGGMLDAAANSVLSDTERARAQVRNALFQLASHAYAEGLRDGFLQGTAAECARRDVADGFAPPVTDRCSECGSPTHEPSACPTRTLT